MNTAARTAGTIHRPGVRAVSLLPSDEALVTRVALNIHLAKDAERRNQREPDRVERQFRQRAELSRGHQRKDAEANQTADAPPSRLGASISGTAAAAASATAIPVRRSRRGR